MGNKKNNVNQRLKESTERKKLLNEMYTNYAYIICANQFDYKTPDFSKSYYEKNIMKNGIAAFYKVPTNINSVNGGKWVCTPCKFVTLKNNYGIGDKVTVRGTDYSLELTVGADCTLIRNNSLLLPESYVIHTADFLTETDISMRSLLRWSRMTPIPKAKREEDIALYENAMQRVIDGDEITVISDPMKIFSDAHETIDDNLLRLTDEKAIEKMHFYSEFYEQRIRAICTLRGLPFTTTAKSSQNLSEELHDMDLFAELYITDCYETRKEDFETAQEFSGFNFEFDWSETMKRQFKSNIVSRETNQNKGGVNDDLQNDGT